MPKYKININIKEAINLLLFSYRLHFGFLVFQQPRPAKTTSKSALKWINRNEMIIENETSTSSDITNLPTQCRDMSTADNTMRYWVRTGLVQCIVSRLFFASLSYDGLAQKQSH